MEELYFAAANSGDGFVSYYDQIFATSAFSRLYLLKGGPGTGKSTLLRRAAAKAEEIGIRVRRYACSSDPFSLDGIILLEPRIAMLDATAPHSRDTEVPGAVDELIDLGSFWRSSELAAARAEIEELQKRKQDAYANAYHWLGGAQCCARNTLHMLERCLDRDKLVRAVRRYLSGLAREAGQETPALIDSFGMHGRFFLPTMHRNAERAYILTNTRGGADLFLREIRQACRELGINTVFSPTYLDQTQTNGVLIPQNGTAFLDEACADAKRDCDKYVNMERFWRTDMLRVFRRELRQSDHSRQALLESAELAFARAREAHFALERIYAGAMDYAALEQYTTELLTGIFADIGR